MKKLLYVLGAATLINGTTLSLIACQTNFLGINLATLPDYNWQEEEPYFKQYNEINYLNQAKAIPSGDLPLTPSGRYIDYLNFNTGFKNQKSIKKQAVTGVPLNSAFLPNGNFRRDFGEKNKYYLYEKINSILDWNETTDHDLKYNQADIPLLKTKKVANKWTKTQDQHVKVLNLGLAVQSTSGTNSIVGSKRMFGNNFNNWQYLDGFTAWAGAADEGIIVPPAADAVDAAHINGSKIYGSIYLDGYHGLVKNMLRDYIARDNQGNYKIVDILIKMAKYLGFDGWFYNNEPNGSAPNGTIMDNKISIEIVKQFMAKVKASNDPVIKNLEMITYKNQGTLAYDKDKIRDEDAAGLATASDGKYVQDFYVWPNDSAAWNQSHPEYNSFDTYNMYNLGGWVGGKIFYKEQRIGTRNITELTQNHLDPNGKPYTNWNQEKNDLFANKWTFSGINRNSITTFAAQTAHDLANMYLENLKHPLTLADDTYATIYQNYYDDMVFTGRNRFLSDTDQGSVSWDPAYPVDNYSFGIGNLVLENTVLFDKDPGALSEFKTNFSTGQGRKFVTADHHVIDNYPWNNRRLADTQLTYKWDIHDSVTKKQAPALTGYYDYYEPYQKGNSIAIGGSFDKVDKKTGAIPPGIFNNKIIWNIMGTNYSETDKNISIRYKIIDANNKTLTLADLAKKFDIKLAVTLDDGNEKEVKADRLEEDNNGWITFKTNLNQYLTLHNDEKIAKIGLALDPTGGKGEAFKVNVGEFSINYSDQKNNNADPIPPYINNLSSEYAIKRENLTSFRLNWTINAGYWDEIAYYEVYLASNNKYYRLGETMNNNYYVKNLQLLSGAKIILRPILKHQTVEPVYQSWNIVV
ncbi:endo-beta-N-acetylglucosaminidase [Spiroplasma endosymbiont of Stenodema calcarata]|uniref:endo-beta-N-acetylglucosaminidase n=1 Tax=Spiroplasma endosymbiont of Stenodema calcarata TaxID=3139328 RepID=UPI003CCB0B57